MNDSGLRSVRISLKDPFAFAPNGILSSPVNSQLIYLITRPVRESKRRK